VDPDLLPDASAEGPAKAWLASLNLPITVCTDESSEAFYATYLHRSRAAAVH
jgi:hypothetical protein